MVRSARVATVALFPLLISTIAVAYDIKPKVPETGFSAKQSPDIVGLTSDTEGGKAGAVYETYLKDLPGVSPKLAQQKFGNTNVSYISAVTFSSPETPKQGAESLTTLFSSPASANRAYYISRQLGFASDRQPSKAEMIQRVTAKYGAPTLIGDGHLYYFYKAGKIVSVKQKYDAAGALAALDAPINPKAAIALNDTQGRGSCVAALKRIQALDKALDKLMDEAKSANCDGLVNVTLAPGITPDRVSKAEFTLVDFKRIVSAAKIDADALAADKNEQLNKTPMGAAPKL